MKIVGIIIGLVLILAIGFMIYQTISYMWEDGYTLGESIEFAWDNLTHLRITKETKHKMENLASRDAEYGIQYLGLRTLD